LCGWMHVPNWPGSDVSRTPCKGGLSDIDWDSNNAEYFI
jgi:hypothetical protein